MFESVIVYSMTFFISIGIASFYKKVENKAVKKMIMLFAILGPILISTIRYKVGTDFMSYYESYLRISSDCNTFEKIITYYQEPLHVVINLLSYKIINSYYGFLFLSSFLVMFFTFKGILNFKENTSISLSYFIFLLTMYHVSFNGIRQAIAVAIIFYAYKYIYERDFKKYIFFVILAGLFHKSAYICAILYFIWFDKGKKEKKYYYKIVLYTFLIPIISKIIQYICIYFNIYVKYFEKYESTTTFGFVLYIIPIILLMLLNKNNLTEENKNMQQFFMRLYILQIPLQIIGNYIPYADRLSLYAMPAQIILLPIFLSRLKSNKKTNRLVVIFWYIFYYIIMFIILKSNQVYPYQTIFSNL